jgi:hypothetical protein
MPSGLRMGPGTNVVTYVKPGRFTYERTRQEGSNSLFLTEGRTLVYWLLNTYVISQDSRSGYSCRK